MSTTQRTAVDLDGAWLLHLPAGGGTREIRVPGTWTTQVPGYGDSHETVRYERSFGARPCADRRLILRFGAVNHQARVLLNGIDAGGHLGGWEPFELDVTDAARDGENRLEVTVSYPPRYSEAGEPGFLEYPVGKQSWYGTTAGIWQSVTLEERHPSHVQSLSLQSDADTGVITLRGRIAESSTPAQVHARVLRGDETVARAELSLAGAELTGSVRVEEPDLWDVDAPHLYSVEVVVVVDGAVVDTARRETGFRSFRSENGRVFLNGREIYLRAVLDQDYHPGSTTAPDDFASWKDLLLRTRALGFNMLRVHIKRPDPRYYEIADRIGMLVWTELPSWMVWTPETADAGHALLRSLIERDSHHPSIVIWTIMNESWGIDLASPTQRAWLHDVFDDIEARAVGSLVVDNSACEPNFHLRTHIDDYHVYRGIPEARRAWDAKIAEYATRPAWTFSPHGDARRSGTEPLVLSEFGNWGLPVALDQYVDGDEPWWFALGAGWAFGAADGTSLMQRFHSLGLEDVFGSWDALLDQLHRAQLIANRYQTTSIRLHDEIRGYVLTQLSDVQWEANGLFDMNHMPKRYTGEFALANGEHAVALRPDAYSVYAGGDLGATITTLPGPQGLPSEGRLRVLVDGEQVFERALSSQREAHAVCFPLEGTAGRRVVAAELLIHGSVVARDEADVLVLDRTEWIGVPVVAGDELVAQWLTALEVPWKTTGAEPSDVLVARRFDDAAQRHARGGGSVLLLVDDADALGDAFGFLPSARLAARTGDGDWVPRTQWLDRRGPFSDVPGDTVLGIAFEDLLGDLVITGIPGPLRPAVVHSAIFSGWLRGAATSTATVRWSAGSVTITTMRLRDSLDTAPIAYAVGRAMLRAAGA